MGVVHKTPRKNYLYNRDLGVMIWADDVINAHAALCMIPGAKMNHGATGSTLEPTTEEARELPEARSTPITDKPKYCDLWRSGYCKYGQGCKYLHELEICSHWTRHRKCMFGDKCRHRHLDPG